MTPARRVGATSVARPSGGGAAAKTAAKPTAKPAVTPAAKPTGKPAAAVKPRRPRPKSAADRLAADTRRWSRQLATKRPGLVSFVLDTLADAHGRPQWQPRLDPTSELILTILSANSADINAEVAFESLRTAFPSSPVLADASHEPRVFPGWGGRGLPDLPPPDWAAVEAAPIAQLTDVIRPGGLANQKAPRIQAALRALAANGGSYSLHFLAGRPPLEARDWLAAIPGIGKKTASVVLLFGFGMPLMPVDRHVHRVSHRVGLIPPKVDADAAHDYYLAMLEPGQAYETHVSLINHGRRTCHAQRPDCEHCPIAPRCRYFDPKAS